MVRESSKYRYTAVSLPKQLIDEVEKYRKDHPEQQYRSNAEYVVDAIREKIGRERSFQQQKIELELRKKMKGVWVDKHEGFTKQQQEEIAEIVTRVIQQLSYKKK